MAALQDVIGAFARCHRGLSKMITTAWEDDRGGFAMTSWVQISTVAIQQILHLWLDSRDLTDVTSGLFYSRP